MAAISRLRPAQTSRRCAKSIDGRDRCRAPNGAQYCAFERINRRGVHVDTPFVERAATLAAEDAVAIDRRLAELTDGVVTTVGQAKRIASWLHDQLPDAATREALTIGGPADDDEDDEAEEIEFSLTRDRVARVLAMLEAKRANGGLRPDETKAFEAATLRLYGAGASPKKFARIAREQIGGVIRDQYRFSGAGQTGRASGKGIQLQNLTRDTLGDAEAALVDAIADGCTHARARGCGSRRHASDPQAGAAGAAVAHRGAWKGVCVVRLERDRSADHAMARRDAGGRAGARHLPRP